MTSSIYRFIKLLIPIVFIIVNYEPANAQKIRIPSEWDINVNGYKGILVIQNYNQNTHDVSGTILGSNFQGHLVGRHIQFIRSGTDQIYEGWILDPALGAHGQPYYDGTLILSGNVVEGKANDGIYPFTARIKNNTQVNVNPISRINRKWQITCYGLSGEVFIFDMNLNQNGYKFTGDMVRTNGSDPYTTVEGQIFPNGKIEFTRKTGNWKQMYEGTIKTQANNLAMRMDGKFGDPGNIIYNWFAVPKK